MKLSGLLIGAPLSNIKFRVALLASTIVETIFRTCVLMLWEAPVFRGYLCYFLLLNL